MLTSSEMIRGNQKDFLKFLKGKFPLYHQSNVFFRDIHFGVMAYLESNKLRSPYTPTEEVAREVITHLEGQKILRKIDGKTWLLDYPEFKAVSTKKPAAPAKPAPAKPSASAQPARPAATPQAKPAVPAETASEAPAATAPTPDVSKPAGAAPESGRPQGPESV